MCDVIAWGEISILYLLSIVYWGVRSVLLKLLSVVYWGEIMPSRAATTVGLNPAGPAWSVGVQSKFSFKSFI